MFSHDHRDMTWLQTRADGDRHLGAAAMPGVSKAPRELLGRHRFYNYVHTLPWRLTNRVNGSGELAQKSDIVLVINNHKTTTYE